MPDDLDAVALAALVRRGEVSPDELARAAIARVDPDLEAVEYAAYDKPLIGPPSGALYGMPTNHGTAAFTARAATRHGRYTRQYLSTGMTVLGKSRLPEFGFNAGSECESAAPVRNPWNLGRSPGASSSGAAALVASGAVPIAHANDGGGSIRIPAACCGLVGLKPTADRHVRGDQDRHLPVHIGSEGVLTRTVRDTAAFVAACEDYWRNPGLPPIGLVEGPSRRRLRVGLMLDTVTGAVVDAQTRAAVESTAKLLERLGHDVSPVPMPVGKQFVDDFLLYWGFLATLVARFGRLAFSRDFDASRLDGLTQGLRRLYLHNAHHSSGALYRLRHVPRAYAWMFRRHELVLSPVVAHIAPPLGHLSPTLPFDELLQRLLAYVAYTPLHNVAGAPAISLPMGMANEGVPIGVMLSAAHGDERTLLELAYALEAEQPWPVLASRQ